MEIDRPSMPDLVVAYCDAPVNVMPLIEFAETFLGWHVRGMLLNNWKQIQSALGVSDKQINQFFGTGSEE